MFDERDPDYDDYAEPQPAELSGPVGPNAPRRAAPRMAAPRRPVEALVAVAHARAFATPQRTGPPI